MTFEIEITSDYNGVKPKNFLKKKIDVPFFRIPKLLKEKRITLNGKKIKQEDIMKTGDILKIWPNDIKLREVTIFQKESKDLGIETIYEDEDLLVFNKKAGIVVQGAQHDNQSLSLHLAYVKKQNKDDTNFEYFHAHRLDKDTSGVLVCCKNRQALRNLNQLFRTRETQKKYVGLVVGCPIETEGNIEVYMKRNPEGSREKMSICNQKEVDAKISISKYKVLETIEHEGDDLSLVEVEIKTGLTHQIRVHMKSLMTPILGDKMYGNSAVNKKYETQLQRQFLHAKELNFTYKDKKHEFKAELTDDLKEFLEYLKK